MIIILVWIIAVIIFGAILLVIFTPLLYGIATIVLFVGAWIASLFVDKQTSKKKKQKVEVREEKEDQDFEEIKKKFGWSDKYGDSYVSSDLGKVLWVGRYQWTLFDASEITGYSVIEKKHNEETYNGLRGSISGGFIEEPVGKSLGFRSGDIIEKMGVIFTTSNGTDHEILEYEGNGEASKMGSDINRHNTLIHKLEEMVNNETN
ncbi:hypothetical protein PPJ95_06160 [Limosilactobacillus reuteri]|uniref:hypothetical protein n=1 Tax=Limosilactobacillus reuteri TaxID=1598 RepID=UPI00234B6B6D|nr:hypothetical protein [Limosilactobacillus reuteri]MDC6077145.1 hypothetical protein [Limosilactobacillus reuteri]